MSSRKAAVSASIIFVHARLAVGAEGLLDVELAERVAERAVGRLHAALPARLDLLGAAAGTRG